ncbi:hypothetical protein AQ475_07340 [Burkholderia thailandensis]|nr:hypothetical protein AQ475_07340 [Burkholderia thailandensis]
MQIRGTLATLMFAAFNVFWNALVPPLSAPPYMISHCAIGAFGLVGALGALAAARAGHWADRGFGQSTSAAARLMAAARVHAGIAVGARVDGRPRERRIARRLHAGRGRQRGRARVLGGHGAANVERIRVGQYGKRTTSVASIATAGLPLHSDDSANPAAHPDCGR